MILILKTIGVRVGLTPPRQPTIEPEQTPLQEARIPTTLEEAMMVKCSINNAVQETKYIEDEAEEGEEDP